MIATEIALSEVEYLALTEYAQSNCLSENLMAKKYLKAILEENYHEIEFFECLGDSVRHRVMNAYAFHRQLLFGYDKIELNHYGWLVRPEFQVERISLKTSADNNNYSYFELAKGANGKWAWAPHLSFGSAGHGWKVGIYDTPYDTRDEALNAALTFVKQSFDNAEVESKSDSSNYNPTIIKLVKRLIEQIEVNRVQLFLF